MRDFWRGDVTHRELWTLIRQLPAESRLHRALAAAAERREEQAQQDRTVARHAALEDQWRRNQEKGLT